MNYWNNMQWEVAKALQNQPFKVVHPIHNSENSFVLWCIPQAAPFSNQLQLQCLSFPSTHNSFQSILPSWNQDPRLTFLAVARMIGRTQANLFLETLTVLGFLRRVCGNDFDECCVGDSVVGWRRHFSWARWWYRCLVCPSWLSSCERRRKIREPIYNRDQICLCDSPLFPYSF